MSLLHQKKLQSIQDKMKVLQGEQLKTEQALGNSLIKVLKDKNAFSLDMNTLIGGIISVIDKIKAKDKDCETWQKIGQATFTKKSKSRPVVKI